MTVVYKPAEVMEMLNLKDSTYKKYILELEKEGYVIQKDGRTRYFTKENIEALEQFIELLKYDGITIPLASKKIAEMYGKQVITEEPKSYDVMTLVNEAVTTALEQQQKQFHDVMTGITKQNNELKEQLKRIEDKHDQIFMESIRESQEAKKLMLEVKTEIATAKELKKSWWKFWS